VSKTSAADCVSQKFAIPLILSCCGWCLAHSRAPLQLQYPEVAWRRSNPNPWDGEPVSLEAGGSKNLSDPLILFTCRSAHL
jgi:hypothetical protein